VVLLKPRGAPVLHTPPGRERLESGVKGNLQSPSSVLALKTVKFHVYTVTKFKSLIPEQRDGDEKGELGGGELGGDKLD
jgi:hypothetical protein